MSLLKHLDSVCLALALSFSAALLAGCKGTQVHGEKEAREQLEATAGSFRPNGEKPVLPTLTTNSGLSDLLTFALLNQPRVAVAYFDWAASVERITVERSLPDPQLTFQMDIQDVVTSIMPGFMMSFPGMGKLRAAGTLAAAESQGKYFAFKAVSLESGFEVKRAYYQLHFLEEKLRVARETIGLVGDLEQLARAQNEVGKVTLQDVLRAQIEQDRLKSELVNLEDSRSVLLARFKAALGIAPSEPSPPIPYRFETTAFDTSSDQLLKTAIERNTRLAGMRADVEAAEAAIRLSYKSRMPDTSVGLMADVKMSPILYRPLGTITLPLWRDKLAAQVAQAQAQKGASEARLTAEEVSFAADFAERLFVYRESTRNLELLRSQLLPKQRQSLEVARSSYLAGTTDFFNLTDTEQGLLRFGLEEVEASTQREIALAEVSLMVEGMPAVAPMGTAGVGASATGSSSRVRRGGQSMGAMR